MERCPQCGGTIGRSQKSQSSTIDGTTFVMRVPAYACRQCKAIFMEGTAIERADLEIACAIASRGRASGETFRFLRKTLGMRAAVVAELLGVTAETISRWENDQRAVDGNAWIALGSIALERAGRPCSTLKRLMAVTKGGKLPKTVRIDLTKISNAEVSAIGSSGLRRAARSPRPVRAAG